MIGGKLAPLTFVDADDTDVDTPINIFNITMTERTSEIKGNRRAVKKTWVTADILNHLCDERRALNKGRHETAEGAEKY